MINLELFNVKGKSLKPNVAGKYFNSEYYIQTNHAYMKFYVQTSHILYGTARLNEVLYLNGEALYREEYC